jgi:hypothetical protein
MNSQWQVVGQNGSRAPEAALPPEAIEEASWDILLALHSDPRCELSLSKLASLASMNERALQQRLAALERRQLVTGAQHRLTGEIRAVLTSSGRTLLDRYISAAGELQSGVRH